MPLPPDPVVAAEPPDAFAALLQEFASRPSRFPDDFCHFFASQGFAVLQPPTMNHRLQRADWTLYGEWLWDALTGLDALAECEEIDSGRIGVVGLSTGGHLALLAAALDARIQSGVVAGIFSTRNHIRTRFHIPPHCDCGSSQFLFVHLEPADLAALVAPRRLQGQHGREDHVMCPGADPSRLDPCWNTGVMSPEEFAVAVREVQRAYQRVHAPERFAVHIHPGGHAVDHAAAHEWIASFGSPLPAEPEGISAKARILPHSPGEAG
jgi:hypothetical protein